jgi:hypothetical protein
VQYVWWVDTVTREFIDSVDVLLHAHAEAIGLAEPGKLCM